MPQQPVPWAADDSPPPPEPESAGRRMAGPLKALAGVAAAWTYVAAVNPNHPGHYPVCPFLYLTGWYCPFCGGLRRAYAVAHGQFGAALRDNAPAVAGYGIAAVLWVVWLVRAARGHQFAPWPSRTVVWGIGVLLFVFTVVRNLPFGSFLAP